MNIRLKRTSITISLFIFLAFFTLGPVITLLITSFNGFDSSIFNGKFALSLSNYALILSTPYDLKALYDTIIVGLSTAGLSLLISLPISYGLSWTSMPFKRFIRTTQMVSIGIPGFIVSLVLIVLTGSIYHLPFHIHSFFGVLVAMSLSSVPFQVLYSTLSFERLDYRLIEASRVNGIGPIKTTFRITVPLLIPGILSGFIVVFLLATGSLSVPLLLAPPSFPMLAPLAYTELLSFFNWPLASADLSLIFMVNIVAVILYVILSKRIPKTVSGKGFRLKLNSNRVMKYSLAAYSIFISLLFIGEIFIVAGYAFGREWVGTLIPSGFTLSYFSAGLSLYSFSPWSTIIASSAAAVFAVLISLIISYGNRTKAVGSPVALNFLILMVFSLSNTIIGISFLALFDNKSTGFLINSLPVIMIIGYVFARLGYASNSVRISVESISDSVIQSARMLVPREKGGFRKITLPFILPGLLEGFLLVFVRSAIDYGSTVFLAPITWIPLSLSSYSFIITGELGEGAALAFIILIITLPLSYYLYRLRSKSSS